MSFLYELITQDEDGRERTILKSDEKLYLSLDTEHDYVLRTREQMLDAAAVLQGNSEESMSYYSYEYVRDLTVGERTFRNSYVDKEKFVGFRMLSADQKEEMEEIT